MRRPSKYRNVKCGGFDSIKEAKRFRDLELLQRAGEISELRTQVTFVVVPKTDKFRAVKYVADFVYKDKRGREIVEDVKGVKTREFVIKQKLMYHVHGIEVICV